MVAPSSIKEHGSISLPEYTASNYWKSYNIVEPD